MNNNLSDIAEIENSLIAEPDASAGIPEWLTDSYSSPDLFWQLFVRVHQSGYAWRKKSVLSERYDIGYDAMICHSQSGTPAFRWYAPNSGWQEISYKELDIAVRTRAAIWSASGAESGKIITILHPLGIEYVISLMTAFRMGMVVNVLQPVGKSFLLKRLDTINPDYIAADESYRIFLEKWGEKVLPSRLSFKPDEYTHPSYSYPAQASAVLHSDSFCNVSKLTAEAIYLSSLRDGAICLNVRHGNIVAAPGCDPAEIQPYLILSVFLNGGTFLHIEPEDIEREPELLVRFPLHAVGISRKVRDILIKTPIRAAEQWKFWFKNPVEASDSEQWQTFIKQNALENILSGNLKWDAVSGGCSLFSMKRKGRSLSFVLPAPGLSWSLSDPSDRNAEAVGSMGALSVSPPGKDAEIRHLPYMMMKSTGEFLFIGITFAARSGIPYPVDEILEIIYKIQTGFHYTMIEVSMLKESAYILLVFTGTKVVSDKKSVSQVIRDTISREMGSVYLPDQICFFPLYPRLTPEGKPDREWCQYQYKSGGLTRKSENDIYRNLSFFRECLYACETNNNLLI